MIEISLEKYDVLMFFLKNANDMVNHHHVLIKNVFDDARTISSLKEEIGNLQVALKSAYEKLDSKDKS